MDLERHDPGMDPGIRASDAERDRVVGLLKQHFTDGRLTMDEFSERMDVAYAARTRGELVSTLRELPVLAAPAMVARPVPRHPHPHPRGRGSMPMAAFPLVVFGIMLVMLIIASRGVLLWPMFFLLIWMGRGHGRRHYRGNYPDWSHRRGYYR